MLGLLNVVCFNPKRKCCNVVWDALTNADDGTPDTRPGAAGEPLPFGDIVLRLTEASFTYRSYRSQLADRAKSTGIIAITPE